MNDMAAASPHASEGKRVIVLTTINQPTRAVELIAAIRGWDLLVVGDSKTPPDWSWPNTTFLSLDEQLADGSAFAQACPVRHYARKNVGYLRAMAEGATLIAETDDDNLPYPTFPGDASRSVEGRRVRIPGWENVYRHFTDDMVWPRGFPLDLIRTSFDRDPSPTEITVRDCAIQQYLADGDPDVDAIYRLVSAGQHTFTGPPVLLDSGVWCPFNSQNTVWWPEAFPLLYLPAHASFRMTDIWRSFVAQICLQAVGGCVAFRASTVYQARNAHSLLDDFELEIPGYLHNTHILELLSSLRLSDDPRDVTLNLGSCYEALVKAQLLPHDELILLNAWMDALPGALRK